MNTATKIEEPLQSDFEADEITNVDYAGIVLSAVCIVHCIGAPFLIALFPMLELLPDESIVHFFLAVIVLVISVVAFYRGYLRHRRGSCFALGMTGAALLFVALLFQHEHSAGFHLSPEAVITTIGGLLLIAAHFWNIRGCHCSCPTCGE